MYYSNSLESYCKQPMNIATLKVVDDLMAERTKNQKVWMSRFWRALAIASVALVVWIATDAFSFLQAVSFICLAFCGCVWAIIHESLAPHEGIQLVIHGVDCASYRAFHAEVETPDEAAVASPLAKSLIKSIQAQDRKMRAFEKNIVNLLSTF